MYIACTTSLLFRFSFGRRERYLVRVLRILACFKKLPNLEILNNPTKMHQTNNGITVSRKELMARYLDAEEDIDYDLLHPKNKTIPLETHYNSYLAHDMVTKRSISSVVGIVDKRAIIHNPKRQTIIEVSTCGAELNTRRAGVDSF